MTYRRATGGYGRSRTRTAFHHAPVLVTFFALPSKVTIQARTEHSVTVGQCYYQSFAQPHVLFPRTPLLNTLRNPPSIGITLHLANHGVAHTLNTMRGTSNILVIA